MTSTGRLSSAVRHTLPQSNYICSQCRLRASTALRSANPSVSLPYASRRYASWIDTNKLRKKIWGTDTPPGQEDPYGKESVNDQRRKGRQQRRERQQEREKEGKLPSVHWGGLGTPKGQTNYEKATTTEGLETVGGPDWGRKEWEAENPFEGFMESKRIEDRNNAILAVHRALVETYALKEAGLPLAMDYYSKNPTEDYTKRVAEGAKFEQDVNGQMILVLESEELRQSILKCVTPQERDDSVKEETRIEEDEDEEEEEMEEEDEEEMEEEEFSEEEVESRGAKERPAQIDKEDQGISLDREAPEGLVPDEEPLDTARSSSGLSALVPTSDTWVSVSLEDAAIKFAVLKRVMQLTGRRIPDPDISVITTPKSLLVHLIKKPKPKRVAEVLMKSNPVAHLPNVQIQDKRYGPIDREIEVGRWKEIKKELEKRGLPVMV